MSDVELADITVTLNALTFLEAQSFQGLLQKEIISMRLRGVSEQAIFEVLLADAEAGGRIFGSLSSGIKSQLYGTISDAARAGERQYYESVDIDMDELIWQVRSTNPCDDCLSREGRVETADYWDAIGRPGSGVTVCKSNCQCTLEPAEVEPQSKIILKG